MQTRGGKAGAEYVVLVLERQENPEHQYFMRTAKECITADVLGICFRHGLRNYRPDLQRLEPAAILSNAKQISVPVKLAQYLFGCHE